MGERNADFSVWLFVLWALMVIASAAGWHSGEARTQAQVSKEKTRGLSAFTLATPKTAPTTREKAR